MASMAVGLRLFFAGGDWTGALEQLRQTDTFFGSEVRAGYEADTAIIYAAFCLLHLGRLRELEALLRRQLRAAERRGDRYLEISLRSRLSIVWLAHDDLAGAERDV